MGQSAPLGCSARQVRRETKPNRWIGAVVITPSRRPVSAVTANVQFPAGTPIAER